MIDLNQMSYLMAIWFVPLKGGDWMAVVYKDKSDLPGWQMAYRFRWYEGTQTGDPFKDTEDRKNWYGCAFKDFVLEKQIKIDVEKMAQDLAEKVGSIVDRLDIDGEPESLLRKGISKPWLHVSFMKAADDPEPVLTTTKPAEG